MIGGDTLTQASSGRGGDRSNRYSKRYMIRAAAERSILTALLTAIIVFCSALLTAIEEGKLSSLIITAALLMALAVFCQKILEFREQAKNDGEEHDEGGERSSPKR